MHTSSFSFTCGYVGADATSSPPLTLATAHPRLQPAQGRASTTPTSWRARHCNECVKRTRPNAVDRLGWTTYRATLRVDLLMDTFSFTFTCGYVGADATQVYTEVVPLSFKYNFCSLLFIMKSDTTKFRLGCHHSQRRHWCWTRLLIVQAYCTNQPKPAL